MNALLRFALAFCPPEFRENFQSDVIHDASYAGRPVFLEAVDIFVTGMVLRFEAFAGNLSYGFRALSRARLYAVVTVLTIALATGANIAAASVLQGVLLSPLPYPDSSSLYYVAMHGGYGGWSYLNAHDYHARSTTVADLGISGPDVNTLLGHGAPIRLEGKQVDGGYFRVLGTHPELGRLIGPGDMQARVAVISDNVWHSYFGGDPRIVGQRIDLGQTLYLIIGVAESAFRDPAQGALTRPAFWIPDDRFARSVRQRGDSEAFVRLRPGIDRAAAQADLVRVVTQLDREHPNPAALSGERGTVIPLTTLIVGDVRPLLWLLYGAVDVLLIIALANVVNLALLRAATRERELAVRSAIGAGRRHIAAQLSAESAILAAAGGTLGLLISYGALRTFAAFGAQILPRWEAVHIDLYTGAYAVALVALTATVSGLLPMLWLRRDVALALEAAGRSGDRSGSKPLRTVLVVTEIALAISIVVAAGLIVRSFLALTHVPIGFDASGLVAISDITPNAQTSSSYPRRIHAFDSLVSGFRAIPGVAGAAVVENVPFGDCCIVVVANSPANSPQQRPTVFNPVSPDYFGLMHIPLLRGRNFTANDRIGSQPVAVVNKTLAVHFFGSEQAALGKTIFPQFNIDPRGKPVTFVPRTIVGVVGDTRDTFSRLPRPQTYVSIYQFPHFPDYVVRLRRPDTDISNDVAAVVRRFDPTLPPPTVTHFSSLLSQDALTANVEAMLFTAFAFLALALALAGVYAVTAYSVEQRTREFGIRKAIGARSSDITRDVLGAVFRYGAAGIAVGIALAALATRLLNTLLFQTSPFDPLTFATAIAIVAACALLAALFPAVRAMRVNPVTALRYE